MAVNATTFLYFAYGSNMLSRRLRRRTPSAVARGTGYVVGRRLTFDKESTDGSGKCDIEPTSHLTDRVYGVIFEILSSQKAALDQAEGLGKGYGEEWVDVVTPSGTVKALAYVATKKRPGLQPYTWYRAFVVAGAREHGLPEAYVDWLETIASKPDADPKRQADNEALLNGSQPDQV